MNEKTIHYLAGELQVSGSDTPIDEALMSASDLIKQLNDEQREANEIIKRIRKENYRLRQENERLKDAMSICDNCSCEIEPCDVRTVRVGNTNAN